MQLGTSEDNKPWVCSVWFAADEDLNIYWLSSISRKHSEQVSKNKTVAGSIVLPQTPEDPPRGLQFQGDAERLENQEDIDKAISVYAGRIFSKEKVEEFMRDDEKPHSFYKIKPNQFVLFDVVNFPENSRQEFNLT